MSQEKYVDDILKRFNKEEWKQVQSPFPENKKFKQESNQEQDYNEERNDEEWNDETTED